MELCPSSSRTALIIRAPIYDRITIFLPYSSREKQEIKRDTKRERENGCRENQLLWKMEKHDASMVFVDDVRNKGAGIEAGRVYKGIDGRARGCLTLEEVEGWQGPIMIDHTLRP